MEGPPQGLTCCPETPIRALLISRPFTKGLLLGSTGITCKGSQSHRRKRSEAFLYNGRDQPSAETQCALDCSNINRHGLGSTKHIFHITLGLFPHLSPSLPDCSRHAGCEGEKRDRAILCEERHNSDVGTAAASRPRSHHSSSKLHGLQCDLKANATEMGSGLLGHQQLQLSEGFSTKSTGFEN